MTAIAAVRTSESIVTRASASCRGAELHASLACRISVRFAFASVAMITLHLVVNCTRACSGCTLVLIVLFSPPLPSRFAFAVSGLPRPRGLSSACTSPSAAAQRLVRSNSRATIPARPVHDRHSALPWRVPSASSSPGELAFWPSVLLISSQTGRSCAAGRRPTACRPTQDCREVATDRAGWILQTPTKWLRRRSHDPFSLWGGMMESLLTPGGGRTRSGADLGSPASLSPWRTPLPWRSGDPIARFLGARSSPG